MTSARVFRSLMLAQAGPLVLLTVASYNTAYAQEAQENSVTIIMVGKVVMPDGTPPPKAAGLERVCSDFQGSGPGPLTDKKGQYTWSMPLSPATERACFIRATLPGFASTIIDFNSLGLSDFTSNTNKKTMPDLVLTPKDSGEANSVVLIAEGDAPGKAKAPYKAAEKAIDAGNIDEGIAQLQAAVKAVPKFADGWNILGGLYEREHKYKEEKEALDQALSVDPKMLSPHLRLARICNKLGDWDDATKHEDALIKVEPRFFPEIYLHQAITRFEKTDLAGAADSIKMAQSLDSLHKLNRVEYVLGRIALEKGDLAAAKEHIANYVKLDPNAMDIPQIEVQLETLGTPEATKTAIGLERP